MEWVAVIGLVYKFNTCTCNNLQMMTYCMLQPGKKTGVGEINIQTWDWMEFFSGTENPCVTLCHKKKKTWMKCNHERTLTLKSSNTSIWFWMIGTVLRSFSVFMVLITPSDLWKKENLNKDLIKICELVGNGMELSFLIMNAEYR